MPAALALELLASQVPDFFSGFNLVLFASRGRFRIENLRAYRTLFI
jgi:hypothetical protein